MSTPELEVIKDIPGYKVILKAVLKSQIQQLVEQLAAHTEEESVILTASVSDGTLSHLGSDSGKTFLVDHEDIKSQFLGFCLRKHHKKKQQEKERQEREEAMRNLPTTPSRQPGPRFSQRSPRYPSPRQQGVYPMALTRASSGGPVRMRHEPYPKPMKRPNFDQQGVGPSQSSKVPPSGHVIKIEPEDPGNGETSNKDSNTEPSDNGPGSSQPSSPSQANADINQTASSFKTETSDRDDDVKSESSASTIPNEASDLKLGDSAPQEDSDFSSVMPAMEDLSGGDNQQPLTPTSAPQTPGSGAELDPNVGVKVEALAESEMELEITGVELGPQPVPTGNTQESWGPDMAGGAMGYSPQGAMGSQADMQGYRLSDMTECQNIYQYEVNKSSSILIDAADDQRSEPEDIKGVQLVQPDITQPTTSMPKKPERPIRLHTCKHCSYVTKSSGNLSRHVRSRHLKTVYTCDTCNRKFKSMYVLQQHARAIHREEKLICEVCSKGFNFATTLAKHKRVVHEKQYRFQCDFCRKKFFDKGHYHGHINTHVKSKPFKCQTCEKSYSFESSLRRHKQSCTAKEDKFKCNILCQKVFVSKVCLQDHTVGRHGAKNKLCVCGKQFSWRSSYTRHQKTCRVLRLNE